MPESMNGRRRARWVPALLGFCLSGCGVPDRGDDATFLAIVFTAAVGIAGTLALLHLLLFAFENRERRNLLFTFLAAAFALVAFLDYRERIDARVVLPLLGSSSGGRSRLWS